MTLARQGASEAAVHSARDAIEGRADLSPAARADHLAVPWFWHDEALFLDDAEGAQRLVEKIRNAPLG